MSASYLLRFDDICPTMNWDIWKEIEATLIENGIKPILAVVPDNRDQTLKVSPANERFWDCVRQWQERGWSIGIHGYQHHYTTENPGILGLNRFSEFAGLSDAEQEAKIKNSLEIFHRENVTPKVWIAPGHSFDALTLKILKKHGIRLISDGHFLFPHTDADEMMWIPQQLWRFRSMFLGAWTIGFHHNTWTDQDLSRFREQVKRFRPRIRSLDEIVVEYQDRNRTWMDGLFSRFYLASLRFKRSVWNPLVNLK